MLSFGIDIGLIGSDLFDSQIFETKRNSRLSHCTVGWLGG